MLAFGQSFFVGFAAVVGVVVPNFSVVVSVECLCVCFHSSVPYGVLFSLSASCWSVSPSRVLSVSHSSWSYVAPGWFRIVTDLSLRLGIYIAVAM